MSIEEQEKTDPKAPAVPETPAPSPAATPDEPPFVQGREVHPDNHEPYDDPVAAN